MGSEMCIRDRLSSRGVAKSPKVDAVQKMPAPRTVPSLRSFLGSVQFYSKFLPNLSTHLEPLYQLTKKNSQWIRGAEEQAAFDTVKSLLCDDTVLAHFDPLLPVMLQMLESELYFSIVMNMAQSVQLPTLQRLFPKRNETTARYRKKHYQLFLY